MERIRINNLVPGRAFSQHLFSLSGQKLLNAGVALNDHHIAAMRRYGELDVILAYSVDELVEGGLIERFDGSRLSVGQRLKTGVLNRAGQVLIEPDQEIEPHHLDALAAGGKAFATSKVTTDHRRERILMSDNLVEELCQQIQGMSLRVQSIPQGHWIAQQESGDWPALLDLIDFRNDAVETLRIIYARIEAGVTQQVTQLDETLDDLMDRLTRFPTRFTQLALLCPRREDYLPDHAYTATVLAMAIAAQLRWPREQVRLLGLAGLLYDLGMLLIPERIRIGACELTDIDRSRVQRHPVFTLSMLQAMENVPLIVRLAALQHHERENGSGYPRGTRRDTTCDFARVLAVADSFAAITEPRHYRRPKLPYIAMEETLRSASIMAFWKPAVRALVQAAGLFPVGSYVKLSDGRNAHVIAANPKFLDRPTVQPLDLDGRPKDSPIDLSLTSPETLSVVRPLASAAG